ncbi:radical SAM domain iron-sulfur cluster-binding oxidoreductase [Geotalea daltonii FRC-32]|uniref:Radical SAM domain iron-sulfur cluster-binding oxidoreductase n=1 Tax=Geotalea daltonii (strain DSM 22248 / JCM 15807 / FRC-32) TaxID=316067 RepID=B9M0I3_GEODF|nr:radical SAM/SPASM domain-containing protein [Geotalea daltonii]ACM19020.1 radical SAM domain iron-sulfur cluster-binding oxidoreductase [Geotalea daltonii FRC-32]
MLDSADVLAPAQRLLSLNFMFTEKCNLKCVYCPQFSENRPMMDTPPELLRTIVDYIVRNRIPAAGVGFYGETLCFKGWEGYIRALLDAGVSMSLCSNWNHKLTAEEARVLSRFSLLQFSIDTTDQDLLRALRPPADARTIIYNMHLIRSQAIVNDNPAPTIMWCSVLSQRIIPHLCNFIAMAVSNGVNRISFNEIEYYKESSRELLSIFDLQGSDFVAAADAIEGMDLLAKKNGVEITYAFNSFLDVVKARKAQELSQHVQMHGDDSSKMCRLPVKGIQGTSSHLSLAATTIAPDENQRRTRLCLAPWTSAYILADGTVCTCCVRGKSMGRITANIDLDAVLQGELYREFRWRLLTGNIIDNACLACPVTPIVQAEELLYQVNNLLGNYVDEI